MFFSSHTVNCRLVCCMFTYKLFCWYMVDCFEIYKEFYQCIWNIFCRFIYYIDYIIIFIFVKLFQNLLEMLEHKLLFRPTVDIFFNLCKVMFVFSGIENYRCLFNDEYDYVILFQRMLVFVDSCIDLLVNVFLMSNDHSLV